MPSQQGNRYGWAAAFAAVGVGCAGFAALHPPKINVVIGGDTQGYLAPCGCTYPMTGGIRRLATAVAQYRGSGGIFLENGGFIDEQHANGLVGSKQNAIKARTLADAFRAMGADAVNIGQEEVGVGRGGLQEIVQLSDSAAVSTSLAPSPTNRISQWIARGPFLIGGITPAAENLAAVTGETAVPAEKAARLIVAEAASRGLTPILLFRGTQTEAEALALTEPGFALIVFKSSGSAPAAPITIGRTLLVTPGDRAKNLVRLEFDGAHFSNYGTVTLTPNYGDDPKIAKYYADYLHEVEGSKLIEQLERHKTGTYAGSAPCMSCHPSVFAKWRKSAHAHALADLERQGHARDPDCLSCHVTGLASSVGFRTRLQTPALANVTCESCHGPGRAHVRSPKSSKLPKLDSKVCMGCHSPENSPNFSFATSWPKISH